MIKKQFFMVIAAIGLLSLISPFAKLQDLRHRNKELTFRIQETSQDNKLLYERQHRLQTDPVYAEAVARQKLNLAKEGEVIYRLLPEE